jgi:hypothetical protein
VVPSAMWENSKRAIPLKMGFVSMYNLAYLWGSYKLYLKQVIQLVSVKLVI